MIEASQKNVVAVTFKRAENFANAGRVTTNTVMIGSAGVSPASRHRRTTEFNPVRLRSKAASKTPALRPTIGTRTALVLNVGSQLPS